MLRAVRWNGRVVSCNEKWEDICMVQLGPDVHFLEEFLLEDQSVVETES